MAAPTITVATWADGVFHVSGTSVTHDLQDQPVQNITPDAAPPDHHRANHPIHGRAEPGTVSELPKEGGQMNVLAVVAGREIRRLGPDGLWTTLGRTSEDLSCCLGMGETIIAGTDDARLLRLGQDGTLKNMPGFDEIAGRANWYAGGAVVDGVYRGPPLGIRSMAATWDGATLFANVHVGGIPRSTDGGETWHPTIDIDTDVHQVVTHPNRPELVIAAAAVGLCISHDGGTSWTIEQRGLHAPHCSAVAFGRTHLFVSASTDPFTEEGALYRRPIDSTGPLERVGGGLPHWLGGIVDTHCLATHEAVVAVADQSGTLYVSEDDGAAWSSIARGLPAPSGVLIR